MKKEKAENDSASGIIKYPSFENFKKTCENYKEVCEAEGITNEETFENFYQTRLYYGFPERNEKFRLIRLPDYTEWVAIDSGLADTIVHLNQHGYKTKYCCEGHKYEEYLTGYIYFAALSEEKQNTLLNLAFGLMLSGRMYVKAEVENDEVTIRFRPNVANEAGKGQMLWAIRQATLDFIE